MSFEELYYSIPQRYPELVGRAAIVTGSGRGIGQGIAVRLAREGVKVVINSRTEQTVEETVRQLESVGAMAIGVPGDVADPELRRKLVDICASRLGPVAILVNNAANLKRVHVFEVEPELLHQELDTNVAAAYLLSQDSAAVMRDNGGGRIVNISSVGGLRAHWRGLPYDITKGAMDAMTRAMALELADYNIAVNALAPGATYNKGLSRPEEVQARHRSGIPMRRLSDPLEMGGLVAFLASDDAAYITGQVIYADGGMTVQLGTRDTPL